MTDIVLDRAAGSILATACGDALGAGYEFGPPLPDDTAVAMLGGGSFAWAPGEWTDDTSMAVPILEAAAAGRSLLDEDVQDDVVATWADWARTAPDVGVQTRAVFGALTRRSAAAARIAAKAVHDRTGRSGGNGSLMRTAPVALAHLDSIPDLVAAARAISGLTHFDTEAAEACVLWCLAIRHAILTGSLDLRGGVAELDDARRQVWLDRIDQAETSRPRDFPQNGWVVQAFQTAWSAIATTSVPANGDAVAHVRLALEAAVRGGNDTDTVAAIAGGLLGARWGASAIPPEWRRIVHGWPGLTGEDLVRMAEAAVRGAEATGETAPATLPRPEPVLLEAVRLLHERGYELLRIHPTFYATGHWRCSLESGDLVHLRYTNGRGWDVLNTGTSEPSTAAHLADRLEAALPCLDRARGADPGYRFWYAAMLEHCGPDAVPYLVDDYTSPVDEGRMGLTGERGGGLLRRSFPLPPGPPR